MSENLMVLDNRSVRELIDEIDPDKVRCTNCGEYSHRMSNFPVPYPPGYRPWNNSTNGKRSFVDYLRHLSLRDICPRCFNLLKSAWIDGYYTGQREMTDMIAEKMQNRK